MLCIYLPKLCSSFYQHHRHSGCTSCQSLLAAKTMSPPQCPDNIIMHPKCCWQERKSSFFLLSSFSLFPGNFSSFQVLLLHLHRVPGPLLLFLIERWLSTRTRRVCKIIKWQTRSEAVEWHQQPASQPARSSIGTTSTRGLTDWLLSKRRTRIGSLTWRIVQMKRKL